MSTILGAQSGYPCPICLVPRDQQYALGNTWPLRTLEGTNSLVSLARLQERRKDQKQLLDQQSLRPITVSNIFDWLVPKISKRNSTEHIPQVFLIIHLDLSSICFRPTSLNRAR